MDEVAHRAHSAHGEFVIERDGRPMGRLDYSLDGQQVEILHTEVDPALRGTGSGHKLVAAVVEWARAQGYHVRPLCSFAKTVFTKTPEFEDVLSH